ncbi:hypothetical protein [Luteimonas sp. MC1750]|uniref:hypothetical protein n=1 Tax=Luteimonas sp. MC1750 TaxID=2799326 RepID=UPI0018F082E0|nr:hypothetical protein [Luteimonas sp. MC1750]MBJ6984013.1 hypothetical protein [Luteimonas sp. MC1750]QQO06825.1 hypothetical protein JGR68_05205 [Luteimonas sp. MC1750]
MTNTTETWYCQDCGCRDIRHDAIARFDPEEQAWEVLSLLDNNWCESCTTRNDKRCGNPFFGTPPEFTVVAYVPTGPEEGHIHLQRPLGPDELVDPRSFAEEVANSLEREISDEGGHIPNCAGDLRVEIRRDPGNSTVIWSGESFYFKES